MVKSQERPASCSYRKRGNVTTIKDLCNKGQEKRIHQSLTPGHSPTPAILSHLSSGGMLRKFAKVTALIHKPTITNRDLIIRLCDYNYK